ncbi:uncharacterized protein [Neodiprion pinetum]|uniref:uncharacterized protein n=1 Tax=Neodiprion pinetum TaxID=441929 RepID=UPI0037179BC7
MCLCHERLDCIMMPRLRACPPHRVATLSWCGGLEAPRDELVKRCRRGLRAPVGSTLPGYGAPATAARGEGVGHRPSKSSNYNPNSWVDPKAQENATGRTHEGPTKKDPRNTAHYTAAGMAGNSTGIIIDEDDQRNRTELTPAARRRIKLEDTVDKLATPGRSIMKTYGSSNNLRREIREKADGCVRKITEELYNEYLPTDEREELIVTWTMKISQILVTITKEKRFSNALIALLHQRREDGQKVIDDFCSEPQIDLSNEEVDEVRETWVNTGRRRKRSEGQRDRNSSEETITEKSPQQKRPKHPTGGAILTSTATSILEEMPTTGDKEDGNTATTPTQESTTARESTQNPAQQNAEEANRGVTIGATTRAAMIIIRAEGKSYQELIKYLKKKVNTSDVDVRAVRKAARTEDALVDTGSAEEAKILTKRITEEGLTAVIPGPRKTRVIFTGIEPTVTREELAIAISRGVGEPPRVIFLVPKEGSGVQTACAEVDAQAAKKLIREGRLRIGWSTARTRPWQDSGVTCGAVSHATTSPSLLLPRFIFNFGGFRGERPLQGVPWEMVGGFQLCGTNF